MIGLRQRRDIGPGLLVLLSIAALACALSYALLLPQPGVAGIAQTRTRSLKKIEDDVKSVRAQALQTEAGLRPRLWTGDVEAVTAAVLEILTREATRQKVWLSAFRPQRPQALEGVTELPFSVQLSGPYPAVHAVAASLDKADSKLALRSVQTASMDAASSQVTATLGLSAYAESVPASEPGPKTGDARG